jgi:hypothetical protein
LGNDIHIIPVKHENVILSFPSDILLFITGRCGAAGWGHHVHSGARRRVASWRSPSPLAHCPPQRQKSIINRIFLENGKNPEKQQINPEPSADLTEGDTRVRTALDHAFVVKSRWDAPGRLGSLWLVLLPGARRGRQTLYRG